MRTASGRLLLASIALVGFGAVGPLWAQTIATHDVFGTAVPAERATPTESVPAAPDDDGQVISQPAGPAPTPRHTGIRALLKDLVADVTHLPSKENLLWAGVGGGLALAVHPVDDNLNRSLTSSDFAEAFFKPGDVLGNLGPLRWPSVEA